MTTPELTVARAAARAGGAIVAKYYREGVVMRSKDIANLVSDADIESEQAIVEVIRRTFPDHKVFAEEIHKDDVRSEHLWLIDPLDGTHNFAHQNPAFRRLDRILPRGRARVRSHLAALAGRVARSGARAGGVPQR